MDGSKQQNHVTPFVGVWIETAKAAKYQLQAAVTPFVGVWIETNYMDTTEFKLMSHPSWVCGLKLALRQATALQK